MKLASIGSSRFVHSSVFRVDCYNQRPWTNKKTRRTVKCQAGWLWNRKDPFACVREEMTGNSRSVCIGSQTSDQIAGEGTTNDPGYELKNITSIDQVSESDWNACAVDASGEENPFILHQFLNSLEQSSAAVRLTGWYPYHLILQRKSDQTIVGCCPLYLKSHSQGEYVFDYQWAQISTYIGNKYYPKLQSCVPFTPVTGSRLLVNPSCELEANNIKRALAIGLKEIADELNISSLHLTFNSQTEYNLLTQEGYIGRLGIQYHWENHNYANFDEFLMELKQSKRKNIRQERKCLEKAGLTVERLIGDDIKARHWDEFFDFYYDTCDRKYGDAYLNREFFHMLGDAMGGKVLLVLAKNEINQYVAGAWNCIGSHALFGRNWGKLSSFFCKNLHFELCYYQALDAAIDLKLQRVEAGAQGEHKIQRGYLPKPTYSTHYIRNEALKYNVQRLVQSENYHLEDAIEYMNIQYSPFK